MIEHDPDPTPADDWGDVTLPDTFGAMAKDVARTRFLVERIATDQARTRAISACAVVVAVVAVMMGWGS